jgi:hypothetical protein
VLAFATYLLGGKKNLYIFFNSFDMLVVKIIIFKNFLIKNTLKKKKPLKYSSTFFKRYPIRFVIFNSFYLPQRQKSLNLHSQKYNGLAILKHFFFFIYFKKDESTHPLLKDKNKT